MKEELTQIACADCGMTIVVTQLFLNRRRSDHKYFYCPNGHANYYKKEEPPKPKPPTVIEREVEVIVEKEYEPKNFEEMLKAHEHDFSTRTKGQKSCKICGLYEVAYKTLSSSK